MLCLSFGGLTALICVFPELSDQIQRALQLEEERRRAQEEAERLEADRLAALQAKEELERQNIDQIKSQEQLAAELAEYTAKIALLEEARKRKESEVEEWQIRVSNICRSCSEVLCLSSVYRGALVKMHIESVERSPGMTSLSLNGRDVDLTDGPCGS